MDLWPSPIAQPNRQVATIKNYRFLLIITSGVGQNGQDVLKPTNKMLETVPFDVVFYSLDWHPDNHVSFIENVGIRKIHPSSKVRTIIIEFTGDESRST